MTEFPMWQDVRDGIVARVGGEQAVAEARQRNQARIDGHRLAERRKALGLAQAQVAEKMGVTKSRVSQVERGEVSTIEVVARYVLAIGGQIQISAVSGQAIGRQIQISALFGGDHYVLRGTVTEAADPANAALAGSWESGALFQLQF